MLCDTEGPISSGILGEFFVVFPFTLKSVQFVSRVFLLAIVGAFSDVTEELEVNFSFADAEFWILNIISMD